MLHKIWPRKASPALAPLIRDALKYLGTVRSTEYNWITQRLLQDFIIMLGSALWFHQWICRKTIYQLYVQGQSGRLVRFHASLKASGNKWATMDAIYARIDPEAFARFSIRNLNGPWRFLTWANFSVFCWQCGNVSGKIIIRIGWSCDACLWLMLLCW